VPIDEADRPWPDALETEEERQARLDRENGVGLASFIEPDEGDDDDEDTFILLSEVLRD
jgi:hypothetical protein